MPDKPKCTCIGVISHYWESGQAAGMCSLHKSALDLYEALTAVKELLEMSLAHVSHGGPSRADAEKAVALAESVLKKARGESNARS